MIYRALPHTAYVNASAAHRHPSVPARIGRSMGPLSFAILLAVLWFPGLRLPITSDTTVYALLGESLWRHGMYAVADLPDIKYLPLHAFLSYPFVWLLGANIGMKVSSLCAGLGALLAAFLLLRRSFSPRIALLAIFFLLFHHGFVLTTMLGSADPLFVALFLGSLAAFARGGEHPRLYLVAGLLLGLASLTRYNGAPLFAFYPAFVWIARPWQRASGAFWGGISIAIGLFALWFLRNALVFGDPLHTGYEAEYASQAPSILRMLARNTGYYVDPLHNVLPVLLALGVWGMIREGRRQGLLLLGMTAGLAMALPWWVRGMRFILPAIAIFLGFAAAGAADLWRRSSLRPFLIVGIVVTIVLHSGALCLYTYGSCNAWVDRTIGGIPADLHITSEGLYGIALARDYIDARAPGGATVLERSPNQRTWQRGVFRSDLTIVASMPEACARADRAYEIVQSEEVDGAAFVTSSLPVTAVFVRECR